MKRIQALAAELHRAVASEEFSQVPHISAEYAKLVAEAWKVLPPGDPEAAKLWREAQDLVAWARQTILSQRAHIRGQLSTLDQLAAYLRKQVHERSTWQLQG
jgi:hypothetical protein